MATADKIEVKPVNGGFSLVPLVNGNIAMGYVGVACYAPAHVSVALALMQAEVDLPPSLIEAVYAHPLVQALAA